MYSFLKKKAKALIPEKFLFKNEILFRYIHGSLYRGNKHQCPICSKKLNSFIKLRNQDLMCPFCGSISRTRRLWTLLNEENALKGNILHFSPPRNIFRILKKNQSIQYYSTDFTNTFLADYQFDITNIDQDDKKFDTIICYHILEHIIEDIKAMSELYRVLKDDGVIFIQTPFKEGNTYEDYSITSEEDRTKYFGQFDHVRIYSVKGLKNRLEGVGFKVDVKTFTHDVDDFYSGFKSFETVLKVTKT